MEKFTIVGNPRTKKNHSQIVTIGGRPRMIPSKQYREYESMCEGQIPTLHIDYPVNVKAVYYMPTRRRVDKTNLESALMDVMVKFGCIEDDNCKIVVSTDGSHVDYDKDNPRTEVEITRLEDYESPFERGNK